MADRSTRSTITELAVRGRVTVVTGATSGLGRALVEVFARAGAKVVTGARRENLGRELEDGLRAEGHDVTFLRTDVRRAEDSGRLAAAALDRHGRIDVLINNAGFEGDPPIQPSHLVTEQQWDAVIDTNLRGAFFCAAAVLPTMCQQRHGVILNIASINAIEGPARMAAYSASKAGLVQLSRTLAVEYVHDGIRVNAVIVGGIDTPQAHRTREAIAEFINGPGGAIPAGERPRNPLVYTPHEMARVLALLCSDDAMITGATVAVDHGMTAGSMASTMIYMTSAGRWQKPYGSGP